MILRLLYVGFVVESTSQTLDVFHKLFGLPGERIGPDEFLGTEQGARIPFPSQCWLYLMQGRQPQSPVFEYMQQKGPGLERLAFLTDNVEDEFERVRRAGVPLAKADLASTPTGRRFVVPPRYLSGVRVEVFEPAKDHWVLNVHSDIGGVLGLQHIGVAVNDLQASCQAFDKLMGLCPKEFRSDQHGGYQKDEIIMPGNDRLWLHLTQNWGPNERVSLFLQQKGEGLEHLCFEVRDIREAVQRVTRNGVPLFEDKIFTNRPDGFEAFVYPEYTTGVTIELIEPYPTSRGYRPHT